MILSTFIAGACIVALSIIGIFFFRKNSDNASVHTAIIPIAVGVFLGVVFFELIPETIGANHLWGTTSIVCGFLGFFFLSHKLRTYHSHGEHHNHAHGGHHDHTHTSKHTGTMVLLGDAVHNFADGVVLASVFISNPAVGALTAVGIALHEIPQEIAEYGLLLRAGYARKRALLLNIASASTILLGIACTFVFVIFFKELLFVITGVAAGNLLYIATTDLIPELQKSHESHFFKSFLLTCLSIIVIATLIHIAHSSTHYHEERGHEKHKEEVSREIPPGHEDHILHDH